MKFKFSTSPNYRDSRSTQGIMRDLTIGLLVVYAFALYKSFLLGSAYGIHTLLLLVVAEVTSFIVEIIFFKTNFKKSKLSLKQLIQTSFPWVTPLIIVLMVPVNASLYAIVIGVIVAEVFGKMLFGGFGQNIFNPAAIGRAVFGTMSGAYVTDLVTGPTPTASFATFGWIIDGPTFDKFVGGFDGLMNLFVGNYAGSLGETSALVMLIVAIFLGIRNVIDWRMPLAYLGTIFLGASIIAIQYDMGIYYPIFHVLTGGAIFGAVFMITDPVTNPNTRAGRMLFAIAAGAITLIIRLKANLPEGVLFSILIMNMFVPIIDEAFAGNQFDKVKQYARDVIITLVVSLVIIFVISTGLEAKTGTIPVQLGDNAFAVLDFDAEAAEIIESDGTTYVVKAVGYEENKNTFEVVIEEGKVSSLICTNFTNTPGIGDIAITDEYLNSYVGKDIDTDVEFVTGATFTARSVAASVKAALEGDPEVVIVKEVEEVVEEVIDNSFLGLEFDMEAAEIIENDGTTYVVKAKGYKALVNTFEVVIEDGKVVSLICTEFTNTPEIGNLAITEEYLNSYIGKDIDSDVEFVTGATFTAKSVAAAVKVALEGGTE
jgi:Na+-translocating ferredoxin:NAD+ oxidoreductase RnfD subunit/uncharacterized protein with FMN-binding domain